MPKRTALWKPVVDQYADDMRALLVHGALVSHTRAAERKGVVEEQASPFDAKGYCECGSQILIMDFENDDAPATEIKNPGVGMGILVMVFGIIGAIAIIRSPENLRVPMWLSIMACGTFVTTGICLALKNSRFTRLYHWSAVAVLIGMAAIPAWLVIGGGNGTCAVSSGVVSCRLMAGLSCVFLVLMLVTAMRQAINLAPATD